MDEGDARQMLGSIDGEFLRRSLCYLESELSPAELPLLASELAADPAKRRAFIRLSLTRAALGEAFSREGQGSGDPTPGSSEDASFIDLPAPKDVDSTVVFPAVPSQGAPAVSGEELRSAPVGKKLSLAAPAHFARRQWRDALPWAVAAVLLLALGLLVLMRPNGRPPIPPSPQAASLSGSAGGRLTSAGRSIVLGTSFSAGEPLTLESGCVELTFGGGAKVIVEAPGQLTFESASAMSLSSGKMSARVSGGGFVVRTPTATITDLGTEFGVEMRPDGATEVSVFKGRVQVGAQAAGGDGKVQVCSEGQAASVAAGAVIVGPGGRECAAFRQEYRRRHRGH